MENDGSHSMDIGWRADIVSHVAIPLRIDSLLSSTFSRAVSQIKLCHLTVMAWKPALIFTNRRGLQLYNIYILPCMYGSLSLELVYMDFF
jgi:hypothetical protein